MNRLPKIFKHNYLKYRLHANVCLVSALFFVFAIISSSSGYSQTIDFSSASISASETIKSPVRETAVRILQEEIALRTSINLSYSENWGGNTVIALVTAGDNEFNGRKVPVRQGSNFPENLAEGFRIYIDRSGGKVILWLIGADERGVIYAVGQFLRTVDLSDNRILYNTNSDVSSAPAYPIRGHQIGYRDKSNSYDAWSVSQYEQYIRELVIFGANSIENIPFIEVRDGPLMKVPREEMNYQMSKICIDYGIDYLIWTPARVDLSDQLSFQSEVEKHVTLYKNTPQLNGVFFPGGDPGNNHPRYIMPFLEAISSELEKYHPEAGVWISLQNFNEEKVNYFYEYLDKHSPDWLAGIVSGPGSPDIPFTRFRLPDFYRHRHYPDITHTVRCQYPVENFDQAFALTQGREVTNPQPFYYGRIHNRYAPFTDGFISYSDGIHDDVNKKVFTRLAWNPDNDIRNIVSEYSRFFFGTELADSGALAILTLEKNWEGPVLENSGIETGLAWWQELEVQNPQLQKNWRWQQLLMRAYFDAYLKHRKSYERNLEKEANHVLGDARTLGAFKVMEKALDIVNRADTEPVYPELRQKVEYYYEALFSSIGLQSSVERHGAIAANRAPFDFIDYPLNNRWWLADEFAKIRMMPTESDRLARLDIISTWEDPGEGSYYDNISDLSLGPRVISGTRDKTDFAWWDNGMSRRRLSTQLYQTSPTLEYHDLVPNGNYIIRISGYGDALLRVEGVRLRPLVYNKGMEEFKEFQVPRHLLGRGKIIVSFDQPEESHLNWREYSKVCDIWLIKK